MKNGTLFWGTLLVAIGFTILLFRYSGIVVDISSLLPYWSVLLILLGTAFIIKQKLAKNILISVVALVSGFAIVAGSHDGNNCDWDGGAVRMGNYELHLDDDDDVEIKENEDDDNEANSSDTLSNVQPQPNSDSTSIGRRPNSEQKNKKKEVVY